jgi:hypothetical protein
MNKTGQMYKSTKIAKYNRKNHISRYICRIINCCSIPPSPLFACNEFKSRKLGTLQGKASIEFNRDWKISDEDLLKS